MGGFSKITKNFRQISPLVRKNVILLRRNIRATTVQLLVPVIFIAFLFLLQLANKANQRLSDRISTVRSSTYQEVNPIPPCIVGPGGAPCYTIGYSQSFDPNVRQLITKIQEDQNIPDNAVIRFKTKAEANNFLLNNQNKTQAVYHVIIDYGCDSFLQAWRSEVCHASEHLPSEIIGVRYAIQTNASSVYNLGVSVDMQSYLLFPLQQAMDRAIFSIFGPTASPTTVWEWGLLKFPHPEIAPINVISSAGPYVIFGALMFNFVIQIGSIVIEKETKVRESMRVMGLRDWVYWLSWAITNTASNIISVFILIMSGAIFQFSFFLKNDFGTYFILLFLFAISMVPLAFFLTTFLSKTETSTSAGFAIFIIGILMQTVAPLIFADDVDVGWINLFSLFPFALLAKGLKDLGDETASEFSPGMPFSAVSDSTRHFFPLSDVYKRLVLDIFFYSILCWYFDNVVYGGRKPWFPFQPSYWCGGSGRNVSQNIDDDEEYEVENVDEDVIAEKDLVRKNLYDPDKTQVVLENLQKTYKGYKFFCIPDKGNYFRAVKGLDLTISDGQLLCLLGHNGAGKTTTIGMLTGLFPCSGGDASIFGFSITTDMSEIRKVMGVCPQHDILWKSLTAEEHLELFAVLRGIEPDKIPEEVNQRLKDVDLTYARHGLAGSFSGGMQRRLSVAIALIGDPHIVFLDEPTTGMDPISRRKVWNLIEKVKRGRVMLLTTHSMEEADILGDKIAIMKDGRLASVGTSLRLKRKFGTGYDISIIVKDDGKVDEVQNFVESKLNKDGKCLVTFDAAQSKLGILKFNIPREYSTELPKFFQKLEAKKKELRIKDFQVSLSTLEEVFLNVAHTEQKEKKIKKKKKRTCLKVCLSIVAVILLIFIILIILRVTFRRHPPPPATAALLGWEPLDYSPSGTIDNVTFPTSIVVSEVTRSSAVVTVVTTAPTLALQVMVVSSQNWQLSFVVDNINTTMKGDVGFATHFLDNLQPASLYSVVFVLPDGSTFSRATRFRTAFDEQARRIKWGATSMLGLTNRPYDNLGQAALQKCDFFVFTGDVAYATSSTVTESDYTKIYVDVMTQSGFQSLASSTSFIAMFDQSEIGSNKTGLLAAHQIFKQAYGLTNIVTTPLYRKISWGTAVDVFVMDIRSEMNATQLISREQMNWIQNGLQQSKATFKLIISSTPITDLTNLLIPIPNNWWNLYPSERFEILEFIDTHDIHGVIWISGGIGFSVLRTGHETTRINQTTPDPIPKQCEVIVGPSGSKVNPFVQLSSQLSIAGSSYNAIIDTWTYTLFDADPVSGNITISFIDDFGSPAQTVDLSINLENYGLKIK